jgi:hypothetical protein
MKKNSRREEPAYSSRKEVRPLLWSILSHIKQEAIPLPAIASFGFLVASTTVGLPETTSSVDTCEFQKMSTRKVIQKVQFAQTRHALLP